MKRHSPYRRSWGEREIASLCKFFLERSGEIVVTGHKGGIPILAEVLREIHDQIRVELFAMVVVENENTGWKLIGTDVIAVLISLAIHITASAVED
jgi:hypothetical protein